MNYTTDNFNLFLFTTNVGIAQTCLSAGVDGIIIDWENKDKDKRQNGYPTQINFDTPEHLIDMRKNVSGKILCRVNKFNELYSKEEINLAISCGADEIFLPMVENPDEVSKALDVVKDRCGLGILIETDAAVKNVDAFGHLPLSRVYIGLNDLHISRKSTNIFEPLTDQTVEIVRNAFKHIPVGVGGITHPERGNPVPSKLLMQQYINLKMNFSFLRRSFLKDLNDYDAETMITDIRLYLQQMGASLCDNGISTTEEIKTYIS